MDPKGETAVFGRRQKVKFLHDNVIAFQDYAWGDGEIFAKYQCSPGVVVDRYQEGDQWHVLISLRETKSAGDIQDFHTTRTIKGGFTQAEEWWQTEIRHRTRWFKLDIIFPKERYPRRAVLIQRSRNRTEVLGRECFAELPDGRQVLSWETNVSQLRPILTPSILPSRRSLRMKLVVRPLIWEASVTEMSLDVRSSRELRSSLSFDATGCESVDLS